MGEAILSIKAWKIFYAVSNFYLSIPNSGGISSLFSYELEQVLDENEFCVFRNNLQETYEPREYCVQYRETDFAFLSRLMEEEGIFYYFVHENNRSEERRVG